MGQQVSDAKLNDEGNGCKESLYLAFFTRGCSLPVSLYSFLYTSSIWIMRGEFGC